MSKLLDTSELREPLGALLADGLPGARHVRGADPARPRGARRPSRPAIVRRDRRAPSGATATGASATRSKPRSTCAGSRGGPFPGVFIRAPRVESVGPAVEVLAAHDDVPVLVRSGNVWVSSFHPELSGDLRIHQLFVNEVIQR